MSSTSVCLELLGINEVRDYQQQFIELIRQKSDAFIILPTGSGKSLAYQLAPFLTDTHTQVLVIMPLESLMRQQVHRLNSCGRPFNAVQVTSSSDARRAIGDSAISHIFVSPEHLVCSILPLLKSGVSHVISHLFIDESHCVMKWGEADKRAKAFREKFASIGDFRSISPQTCFVAMTATATKLVEMKVASMLQMGHYETVRQSPEKANLRYSIIKVGGDMSSNMHWLVEELASGECAKTIVFFKQLHYIGDAYRYMERRCPTGTVAMYHSQLSEESRNGVVDRFCVAGSTLKCVLCSSAFSMGLDIPDIKRVVEYGVPKDLDDYVQQSGRAGRDGSQAHSIILHHPHALTGEVSDEMKQYVKGDSCRREMLMTAFGETMQSRPPGFRCCDICARAFSCCSCGAIELCEHTQQNCYCVKWCCMLPSINLQHEEQESKAACRQEMSVAAYQKCVAELTALGGDQPTLPQNVNGFYPELIASVMDKYCYIGDVADILNLGALSVGDANEILNILNNYSETFT